MKNQILQKADERPSTLLSNISSSQKKQICSFFFWRIYSLTICFRNQLTFRFYTYSYNLVDQIVIKTPQLYCLWAHYGTYLDDLNYDQVDDQQW